MANDKTIALNVYMPESVLKKFKIKCINEGVSMKAVIIDFVNSYAEGSDEPSPTDDKPDEAKED